MKYLIFVMSATLLLAGCDTFQDRTDDPVLARVGNDELTLSSALSSIPEFLLHQDSLSALESYQQSWVENKVMEREARRLGLDQDDEIRRRVDRLESQLLVQALRESLMAEHADELGVDAEEARNYYQENRDRFRLDERYVRTRHLRASSRADAVNARDALLSGRDWESVAREYSIDSERQIRLSEQYIPESLAFPDNPTITRLINRIGIDEISPIQQVSGEFQFVQLLDERPEGDHPDLDWLVSRLEEWLHLERSKRFINTYRRNLYLQAEANNEIELIDVGDIVLSNTLSTIEPE